MTTRETLDSPELQREAIFSQITERAVVIGLRKLLKRDQIITWSDQSNEVFEIKQWFSLFIQNQPDLVYKSILALADTIPSTQPDRYANTMGLLYAVNDIFDVNGRVKEKTTQAKNAFLDYNFPKFFVSDEAVVIKSNIIQTWKDRSSRVQTTTVKLETLAQIYNSFFKFFYGKEQTLNNALEALFSILIDPTVPRELRKAVLDYPSILSIGSFEFTRLLAYEASVWKQDYSAVFLETNTNIDPRDLEIAYLRAQLATRESTRSSHLEKKMQRLQSEAIKLAKLAQVYRELGGDPLDILGISHSDWNKADDGERKRLLKKAYRTRSKEHHYQVPVTSHLYDKDLEKYKNQAFRRATAARDYLEKKLK